MPVWVGPGEGLVPPVDGVGGAVQAVVVGGVRTGRRHRLQALRVRLGQRLQPGEENLGAAVRRHLGHLGELASVQVLSAAVVILQRDVCIHELDTRAVISFSPVIDLNCQVF